MAEEGLERGDDGLEVYVMCEIPNNVILIDEFAKRFDGFSIGSNDLTQLTLGVDRDSEMVAFDFDERDPGVLAFLKQAVEGAKRNGRHSGICGQAPSDYLEIAKYLVELGIDSMSLTPDSVLKTMRAVVDLEKQLGREVRTRRGRGRGLALNRPRAGPPPGARKHMVAAMPPGNRGDHARRRSPGLEPARQQGRAGGREIVAAERERRHERRRGQGAPREQSHKTALIHEPDPAAVEQQQPAAGRAPGRAADEPAETLRRLGGIFDAEQDVGQCPRAVRVLQPAGLPDKLGRVVLAELNPAFGHRAGRHAHDREPRQPLACRGLDRALERDRRLRREAGGGERPILASASPVPERDQMQPGVAADSPARSWPATEVSAIGARTST